MDIDVAYRLLDPVDISDVAAAIALQPEAAWLEQLHRQRAYDVHHQTQSIVLLFCDDAWPDVTISREPGWDRLADVCMPLMDGILARHYPPGGRILRAMAARLIAGGRISPHIDALPSFRAAHRIHVPITSGPGVRFTVDGRPCPMEPGGVCEINNQKVHSVINRGDTDRVSFIFDYQPAVQ
jgi:hypothetical protein